MPGKPPGAIPSDEPAAAHRELHLDVFFSGRAELRGVPAGGRLGAARGTGRCGVELRLVRVGGWKQASL